MSSSKFFRNAYPSGKKSLIHQLRDGESFIHFMPLFIEKGFEYGGLLLNFDSDNGLKASSGALSPGKGDVLVLTTRPPLSDEDEGPHLVIRRGGSALEHRIFNACRKYLSECSRRQVTLNESFVDHFKSGFEDRCSITFTGHGKITGCVNVARYQATVDRRRRVRQWRQEDGRRTAVYFIYTREAWDEGPDLLISFGMTGACNLIWAYLINTKFPHFLNSPRIVVAEMIIGDIPALPDDLSFVEDWHVNILLDHKL